jgi:hypothetical protein
MSRPHAVPHRAYDVLDRACSALVTVQSQRLSFLAMARYESLSGAMRPPAPGQRSGGAVRREASARAAFRKAAQPRVPPRSVERGRGGCGVTRRAARRGRVSGLSQRQRAGCVSRIEAGLAWVRTRRRDGGMERGPDPYVSPRQHAARGGCGPCRGACAEPREQASRPALVHPVCNHGIFRRV